MSIQSCNPPKNEILHQLFDKFMEMMNPALKKGSQEKWWQFHGLLQENPINYYNIQAFLINFDQNSKCETLTQKSSQESERDQNEFSNNDKESEKLSSQELNSEQGIPQILVEKTTELMSILTKNTDRLNKLFRKRSETPTRKKVRQQVPLGIARQATYFQTYQQNNYPIYNPRQHSTYQPQFMPATVQNQQYQSKIPYQQQSFHSQQHSFQYISNQYMEKGIFKTFSSNNGPSLNNLFY